MATVPEDFYSILARIESNNNPLAKATTSSASGLFQFVRSTWEGLGGTWGTNPNLPFGGHQPTIAEQTDMARKLTEQNAAALQRSGITLSPASLYAAHFLGSGAASKVLAADPSTPMKNLVSSSVIKANKFLTGMTAGDFWDWLVRKTGSGVPFDGGGTGDGSGTFQCPHCGQSIRYHRG